MEDFGTTSSFEAEAIGEPGQRTFRLRLRSGERTASLWLEKEQLQALAVGLMRLFVRVGKAQALPVSGGSPSPLSPFPERPTVDLQVGRLGLGYRQSEERVLLFAYGIEEEAAEGEAAVACRAGIDQCRELIVAIEAILAAGRPICRLCLIPIDPEGHVCARHNGNRPRRDLGALR